MTPEETLEVVGSLVDKSDNYLALADNGFMPKEILIDGLKHGLADVRQELIGLYIALGGVDQWPDKDE